jgi:branched-subunit amino acid ABC-type transport system permease component
MVKNTTCSPFSYLSHLPMRFDGVLVDVVLGGLTNPRISFVCSFLIGYLERCSRFYHVKKGFNIRLIDPSVMFSMR